MESSAIGPHRQTYALAFSAFPSSPKNGGVAAITVPPQIRRRRRRHSSSGMVTYCSLDKGVAYLQSGGKSSNTSPPTDVCPHQVSCGAAASQMFTLSNSAPLGANTNCSQFQQGAVRRRHRWLHPPAPLPGIIADIRAVVIAVPPLQRAQTRCWSCLGRPLLPKQAPCAIRVPSVAGLPLKGVAYGGGGGTWT